MRRFLPDLAPRARGHFCIRPYCEFGSQPHEIKVSGATRRYSAVGNESGLALDPLALLNLLGMVESRNRRFRTRCRETNLSRAEDEPCLDGSHCPPGVSRTVRVRAKASVMLEPYSQESICTKGVRVYFGFAMSRYLKSGSPGECRYCGRPLEGCAIRERETNRYYCSDDCLERDKIEAFRVLAALWHQMLA